MGWGGLSREEPKAGVCTIITVNRSGRPSEALTAPEAHTQAPALMTARARSGLTAPAVHTEAVLGTAQPGGGCDRHSRQSLCARLPVTLPNPQSQLKLKYQSCMCTDARLPTTKAMGKGQINPGERRGP